MASADMNSAQARQLKALYTARIYNLFFIKLSDNQNNSSDLNASKEEAFDRLGSPRQ